jgi:putative colanic acid biosynthesis UDP-glucose lipid carrier transferase
VQRILDVTTIVAIQYAAVAFYRQFWTESNSLACAVTIAIFGLVGEVSSLYRPRYGEHLGRELTQLMVVWLVVIAMLLMVAFATKTSARFSRVSSTLWIFVTPTILSCTRVIIRIILRRFRKQGYNIKRAAIVGCTPLAERLINVISNDPSLGLNVVGVYDDRTEPRQIRPASLSALVLGNVEQLVADARAGNIDHIYLALPLRAEARVTDILHRLADTTATVYFVPDFFVFDLLHARMTSVGDLAHNEQYRSLVHNYMLRHKVKPGITGWAQVNGWRGETNTTEKMQKRVEHDLYYIQNWHLGLDIKILWMTVFGRRVRENAF